MKNIPKDLIILSELRNNARESLTKMSRRTRIPISTLHDRIKTNLNDLIKKNCALIDFSKLGFPIRINLLIKVPSRRKKEIADFLKNNFHVNTLLKVTNEFDFLAELIFKDIKSAGEFIDDLEEKFEIEAEKKYFIIDELKKEEFLSDKELLPLLTNMPKLNSSKDK